MVNECMSRIPLGGLFHRMQVCCALSVAVTAVLLAGCVQAPRTKTASAPPAKPALASPTPTPMTSAPAVTAVDVAVTPLRTADPGPGVVALDPVSPSLVAMAAGGTFDVQVRAVPGAAVVFLTRDGGRFVGGSNVVQAIAGPDGVATARYHATPDAVEIVNLQISSPACSGVVHHTIRITQP